MSQRSKLVPRYCRHRASGQATVTINGRDFYLGTYGSQASHAEYDRRISEWLSTGRSTSYGVPEAKLSIAGLLVAYLNYAKRYYGDGPRCDLARARRFLARMKWPQPERAGNRSRPVERGRCSN
jgi:hypothetical protein